MPILRPVVIAETFIWLLAYRVRVAVGRGVDAVSDFELVPEVEAPPDVEVGRGVEVAADADVGPGVKPVFDVEPAPEGEAPPGVAAGPGVVPWPGVGVAVPPEEGAEPLDGPTCTCALASSDG